MEERYHWLDGYVFMHSPNPWKNVCDLWASGEVRYMGKLENEGEDPDRIAIFVEADTAKGEDSQTLRRRMDAVRGLANPSSNSGTAIAVGPDGPTRWSKKKQWGAFVRIKAETGDGKAIFDWLNPEQDGAPFKNAKDGGPYCGHAQCTGDWHVLLELGADKRDDLVPLIKVIEENRTRLRMASVIVSTQKNHMYAPARPERGQCRDWDGSGSNGDHPAGAAS